MLPRSKPLGLVPESQEEDTENGEEGGEEGGDEGGNNAPPPQTE